MNSSAGAAVLAIVAVLGTLWGGAAPAGPVSPARMIVLGVDGLDPKLMAELLTRGDLPNIRRLIAEGWLVDIGLPETSSPSDAPHSIVRWRGEPEAQPAGLRWALEAVGTRMLLPAASWIGSRLAQRSN